MIWAAGQLCVCMGGILQTGRKSWQQKLANMTRKQKPHLMTKVFLVDVHDTCQLLAGLRKSLLMDGSGPVTSSLSLAPSAKSRREWWKGYRLERKIGVRVLYLTLQTNCMTLGESQTLRVLLSVSLNQGTKEVSRSFRILNLWRKFDHKDN